MDNTVSFVSIFWYNLNGFLNVENVPQFYFSPAKKAPDEPRGVVPGPLTKVDKNLPTVIYAV